MKRENIKKAVSLDCKIAILEKQISKGEGKIKKCQISITNICDERISFEIPQEIAYAYFKKYVVEQKQKLEKELAELN